MPSFWYIVKVLPGKEKLLCDQFNQQIKLNKIKNILRFLCPTEDEVVILKKKKILRKKVIYSGYLYFESEKKLESDELSEISIIPNIMGLMGNKIPKLMNESDANKIIKDELLFQHNEDKMKKYSVGNSIIVTDGAFTGFNGIILDTKGENIDLSVKIFGRDTKISLTSAQIKHKLNVA